MCGRKVDLFGDKLLKKLSIKYNKTIAQITLNWLIKRGLSVIPKSTNSDRMKENLEVLDFEISSEDSKKIIQINKNLRTIDPKTEYHDLFNLTPIFD